MSIEDLIEDARDTILVGRKKMTVVVHGHADRAVARKPHDLYRVRSFSNQDGERGVPQAVECNFWQAGSLDERSKLPPQEVALAKRTAVSVTKD
ncbi:MAG TPA: hypothetical protein VMA36_22010 [Candidatus Limnocylindria bacterium]|nr:hypothetical protein [Candidatus Limnocylindria bacterium]